MPLAMLFRLTNKFKILLILGVLSFLFLTPDSVMAACDNATFGGGTGTSGDPWLISTPSHLNSMRDCNGSTYTGKYFKLTQDIDLNVSPYNTGSGWDPIGSGTSTSRFYNNLDGDDYTISNLMINRAITSSGLGFFGSLEGTATVTDLNFTSVNITNTGTGNLAYTGVVAGMNYGTLTNISTTGTVTNSGWVTGGLVGKFRGGTITRSRSSATISTVIRGGGLVGEGGNSGQTGSLTKSFSTGSVNCNGSNQCGGLIGILLYMNISNTYARGSSTGSSYIGGHSGFTDISGLSITNSYSTGVVTAASGGGFIGAVSNTTMSGNYWDTQTSGTASGSGATGRTTSQMKTQGTFSGWDFSTIWGIDGSINDGYPYLLENAPVVVAAPTSQASSVSFSSTGYNTTTISWTIGNGSSRAVFIKAASSGSAVPVDGTTYTASTTLGSGTQIGSSGWYTVYNGSGTSVTITGLSASTEYRVQVFEYNGSGASSKFFQDTASNNPNNVTTTASYTLSYAAGSNGSLTGTTSQTVSAAGSGSAVTAVPDSGYVFVNWSDSSTSNPRTDSSVNANVSVTASFVLDPPPEISTVASTPGSTTATITWATNEQASSQVDYGLTSAYGLQTAQTDTSPRVTSHSVSLSSLKACAIYFYRVRSIDNNTGTTVSSQNSLITTGCTASSITTGNQSSITTASGGTVSLVNGNSTATITAPSGFAAQNATFQLNKLDTGTVPAAPTSNSLAGNNYYDLIAVGADNSVISSFNSPVTFSVNYGSDVESSYAESTLDIYKYNGSVWVDQNCTLNTGTNTLTCSLSSFSVYAVFGQEVVSPSTSPNNNSTSSPASSSNGPASCTDLAPTQTPELFQIDGGYNFAVLNFKTVTGATGYQVSYGLDSSAQSYGDTFHYTGPFWILTRQINNLTPYAKYYFKVKALNGCNAGGYSQTLPSVINPAINYLDSVPVPEINKVGEMPVGGLIDRVVEDSAKAISKVPVVETLVDKKIEIEKSEMKAKPSVLSYVVKEGENLWEIATEIFGEGRRYVDLIAQKTGDSIKNLKPGDLVNINSEDLTAEQKEKSFPETSTKDGYDLDVKVLAYGGKPLSGGKVTLHSTPRDAVTNNDGVAKFENVEPGEHKVYLAFNGYSNEGQSINVTGDNKDIELVMEIKLTDGLNSPKVKMVLGVMVAIIVVLVLIIFKNKTDKKRTTRD